MSSYWKFEIHHREKVNKIYYTITGWLLLLPLKPGKNHQKYLYNNTNICDGVKNPTGSFELTII